MRAWLTRIIPSPMRALFLKELHQIRRDRRIVVVLVLPPILQLMLFGTVMSPDVASLQLGIVDESRSPQSRGIVAALGESGSFRLSGFYTSAEAMGRDVDLGTLDVGVVIPSDFARDLERGRSTAVQVLLNAMNPNSAAVGQVYVQGVIQSYNRSVRGVGIQANVRQLPGPSSSSSRGSGALLRPVFLFNPGLETAWFLVTGLLGQLLLMNGLITSSTTMVKEREAGTLEQLLMTPARIPEIIVAKILPSFLLLSIPALIALGVIRVYFGVPFRGSVWILVVASAACILCGIGLGTFVATITKSAQQAQLSTFFIMPPMMSLSGALMPAEALPVWLRPWTAINPIYHFGVISRGTLIRGSGIEDVWVNVLALVVFALVLMSLSVWRFRQQLS